MQNKLKTVLKIGEECSVEEWMEMYKSFSNIHCRLLEDHSFFGPEHEEEPHYLKSQRSSSGFCLEWPS